MRNRILLGLILITFMAVPMFAHRIALKDGKTVQFEKYWATETILFCTDADGKETAITLAEIDLDRTQQLNAQEPVPLDLPGLTPVGGTNGQGPSLTELARQQKNKTSGSAAKRVLTDDSVLHSSPEVPVAQAVPTEATNVIGTEPMQKIVDKFANKSQTQLANDVVGDIQFPGRDAWEQKLYGQAQRVLRFAQSTLDRTKKLETLTDPTERSTTLEIAKNLEWQANEEETVYAQISTEGSQKAKESEKQSN